MSLANNKKSLIIAAMCACFAFVLVASVALPGSKQQKPVNTAPKYQYVVATREIKVGELIKEEDVTIKDYTINIPSAYKATGEVVGRDAMIKIEAGKPVMKSFVKELVVKEKEEPKKLLPDEGYRAFPILMRKNDFPSFVASNKKFDLYTRENSMKIENVRVLDILDTSKEGSNKMLILEIKNDNIKPFIKYVHETKGLVFLEKNPGDIGEYNFYDIAETEKNEANAKEKKELEAAIQKYKELQEANRALPPVQTIKNTEIPDIEDITNETNEPEMKQVEIIVGSTKSTVDFKD